MPQVAPSRPHRFPPPPALSLRSVPTFTVVPEAPRSPSPLMVVDEEEEPTEGVPIEQYRAWLGEPRGQWHPRQGALRGWGVRGGLEQEPAAMLRSPPEGLWVQLCPPC